MATGFKLTNEEYRTLRQACGFTQIDAQHFHGIKNKKTISRWENGQSSVSERASAAILELNHRINKAVQCLLSSFDEAGKEQPGTKINLILYAIEDADMISFWTSNGMPVEAHNATIRRAWLELTSAGVECRLVLMKKAKYFHWLKNRKDSTELRTEWAAEQIQPND